MQTQITEILPPTLQVLEQLAADLEARDFVTFAERVSERWPALGAFESLHAQAADGNSPDVQLWADFALDDCALLQDRGVAMDDVDGARRVWSELYDEAA